MTDQFTRLLEDTEITEVLINSWDKVYFEKKGKLEQINLFTTPEDYSSLVKTLSRELNFDLSFNRPQFQGLWKDFRVHLIHHHISKTGTLISFRRIKTNLWTLDELEKMQFLNTDQRLFLENLIQNKKNLIVCGPTGCGKTTFMNALLLNLDKNERVAIIEDTDELHLPNKASIKLLCHTDPQKLTKEVLLEDLIKESLRLRPDRIVVGEVRGRETKDLILALATGHSGSITSFHGRSAREALLRLEMLVQLGAPDWSLDSIRKLIFLSVNYIITIDKVDGVRKLKSIDKILSLEDFGFVLQSHSFCKKEEMTRPRI